MLSTDNHRRDSAGMLYVYPVVSRRANGVSLGINLNTNNACNWACVYCQVENLSRGGPPSINLPLLEDELQHLLDHVLHGDFMQQHVPSGMRQLVDVAFSGNGEPTSSADFLAAIETVTRTLDRFSLQGKIPLRLITNGSFFHRPGVLQGVQKINRWGGEVWFKLDRASDEEIKKINGVAHSLARILKNLDTCCALAPTWIQTCWFAFDGQAPSITDRQNYCNALRDFRQRIRGIHLYGLARPSQQNAADRLTKIAPQALDDFAAEITEKTGIQVLVSP